MPENIALGINAKLARHEPARAHRRGVDRLRPDARSRPRASARCRSASASASRSCAACCRSPKLLIMDEPTSVLTPQEVERCSRRCGGSSRRAARSSTSATSWTRSARCATRATILRGGKVVGRLRSRGRRPRASLAEMMIGATLDAAAARGRQPSARCGSTVERPRRSPATSSSASISRTSRFEVRAGEILGIAGVAGNGQNELMQALIGERSPATRRRDPHRRQAGRPAAARPRRRALGLCFVPEERNGHAAVPDMSLCRERAS